VAVIVDTVTGDLTGVGPQVSLHVDVKDQSRIQDGHHDPCAGGKVPRPLSINVVEIPQVRVVLSPGPCRAEEGVVRGEEWLVEVVRCAVLDTRIGRVLDCQTRDIRLGGNTEHEYAAGVRDAGACRCPPAANGKALTRAVRARFPGARPTTTLRDIGRG